MGDAHWSFPFVMNSELRQMVADSLPDMPVTAGASQVSVCK
jgi:hypothetical protein